jgi:hypothetical protein
LVAAAFVSKPESNKRRTSTATNNFHSFIIKSIHVSLKTGSKRKDAAIEIKDLLKEHGNKVIGEVTSARYTRHAGMTAWYRKPC